MNQPTAKHREEAREIVQSQILQWHTAGDAQPSPLDVHRVINTELLTECIASALSSRDAEIREVLEGLRTYTGCWCNHSDNHASHCLAARALWERVRE